MPREVRYALRGLRKAPVFTATAILTLALGIGATTAIFTLVDAVLLKSLPVADPGQLYRLGKDPRCCYSGGYSQDKEFSLVSYDLYKYLRDNTRGFAQLAAFQASEPLFGVRRSGAAQTAQSYPGEFVSGNYFVMFGISAYAGRMLTPEDDRRGAPPVAVLSHSLWQQKYGSDPSVIGSVFDIDGKPFTIVGVAPPGFFGDRLRVDPPDLYLPLNTEPIVEADADLNESGTHWLDLIGRVQPRAKVASMQARMRVELKQWLRAHWGQMSAQDRAKFPRQTLYLRPGGAGITSMREQYEHWLQILMLVSGFVLLIVCANVANLMLIRGLQRRPQTALSIALGARARRLLSQGLIESILLSLAGGAAGLAVAVGGTRLILYFAFASSTGAATVPIHASPYAGVLLFAFAVSMVTGAAFGIAPAWMATRVDPLEALRGGARATGHTGSMPRNALVVSQTALSLVLLCASGLLITTLHRLEHQHFGFDQNGRIVANINPRLAGYRPQQLPRLYRRIRDSVAGIPGVSSVALSLYSPLGGNYWGSGVWVSGHPSRGIALWDRVTAGYFDVIGTPIVEGRGIAARDTATSGRVAVVNEAFAREFFGDKDPIGRHFGIRPARTAQFEVVGVAKNARYVAGNLDRVTRPMFFLPEPQADYSSNQGFLFLPDLVVRLKPGVHLSVAQLRRAMSSVDPNLPIVSVHSLADQVTAQFTQPRLIARLTSLFGVLAIVLSCIGLYGLIAYSVECRKREIAMRMALGASRSGVLGLILRAALRLTAVGLVIGLPVALAAGPLLGSQLYGLNPYDPYVVFAAVAALSLAALVASVVPAIRASLVSPQEGLRSE